MQTTSAEGFFFESPITSHLSAPVAKKACSYWKEGIFRYQRNILAENALHMDNPAFSVDICRLYSACNTTTAHDLSKLLKNVPVCEPKPKSTGSNKLLFTLLTGARYYRLQDDLSSSAHCLIDWTYYYTFHGLPSPPLDQILLVLEHVVSITLASHVASLGSKMNTNPLWLPTSWVQTHILPYIRGGSFSWRPVDKV